MARLFLGVLLGAAAAAADKVEMARDMGLGGGPRSAYGGSTAPPGVIVTETGGNETNSSTVWAWYARAEEPWASNVASYALWGSGNYASYAWGRGPFYTADYACQGGLIAEKILAHGGPSDRAVVAVWLATLPMNNDGKLWEAQNVEWHCRTQGAWESSAEGLIGLRAFAAYAGSSGSLLTAPSERLVCASSDGGATFHLAGVPQFNVSDAICSVAPRSLPSPPEAGDTLGPFFFVDSPMPPSRGPSDGVRLRYNSGRILTQALQLAVPATHLSLALTVHKGAVWPSNVTVVDVATGKVVADAPVTALGTNWTVVDVRGAGGDPLPAGAYVVALAAAADSEPAGTSEISWVGNLRTGGAGGGASSATYGDSPHWLRDPAAPAANPALIETTTPGVAEALALELRRVRARLTGGGGASPTALGRSVADAASLMLAWTLALSSQVPLAGGGAGGGGYDVFVIPDPVFRGSLETATDSGNSYYDLLRIGFTSAYINMRALEGVLAYAELQVRCSGGGAGTCCVRILAAPTGVRATHNPRSCGNACRQLASSPRPARPAHPPLESTTRTSSSTAPRRATRPQTSLQPPPPSALPSARASATQRAAPSRTGSAAPASATALRRWRLAASSPSPTARPPRAREAASTPWAPRGSSRQPRWPRNWPCLRGA